MLLCIGLIGYGYWGPNIARALSKINGVKLTSIADFDAKKLDKAKNLYPNVFLSSDPNQVLQDPTVDAVIIATPASTHFDLATKALSAGKHILIEKPLTISTIEANALHAVNKKAKKTIMVGHTFEYNAAVLKMKKIVDSADFGNILYVYSSRVNLGQIRGDINALWNLAPHDISILNFLTGNLPTKVMAVGASFLQQGIEDVAFISLRYPGNILAEVHVSWLNPSKERVMTVVGSKKMLIFDDIDNEMPIKVYDKRVDTGEVAKGLSAEYKIKLHSGDIYVPQIDYSEPLMEELNHFVNCIINVDTPRTDIINGMNVVKVLEGCQMSLDNNNKWVELDEVSQINSKKKSEQIFTRKKIIRE